MTSHANKNALRLVLLLAALFLLLPLIYWPGFLEAASLPRFFVIGITSSAGLILWGYFILRSAMVVVWHHNFWLIIVFFGWAGLSTAWSPDSGTSLIEITQLASMVILAFLAMQVAATDQFSKIIIPAILGGALITALIGIGQYFDFNPLNFRLNKNNIASTFINRNHAAVYFDLVIPIALTSLLFYTQRHWRWLSSLVLGCGIAFLLVNKSRGSLLSLIIVVIIFGAVLTINQSLRQAIFQRIKTSAPYLVIATLLPLIILLLPNPSNSVNKWDTHIFEQKNSKPALAQGSGSDILRFNTYINSLPLIAEQPLTGTGYGGFRRSFRAYSPKLRPLTKLNENSVMASLHSDPLQYFVELGIAGGLLALGIFFLAMRSSLPSRTVYDETNHNLLKLGLFLSLVAGGIHASIDFPLHLPTSAALFWFYLGAVFGLVATQRDSRITESPLLRHLPMTIGVLYLLVTVGFYHQYFQGSRELLKASINAKKGECELARAHIEQSLRAFDLNYITQNRYAQIYAYCNFPLQVQLNAMNKVLAYDPTNVLARLSRGVLHVRLNQPDAAESDLLYVVETLPHRPHAYLALGDVAFLKNDHAKAKFLYTAALKRDPDNINARAMLTKLEKMETEKLPAQNH